MFYGIISFENSDLINECLQVLKAFKSIRIKTGDDPDVFNEKYLDNLLFLITDRLGKEQVLIRTFKGEKVPRLPIIFYSHSLMLSQDTVWDLQEDLYFVVGEERMRHLAQVVEILLKNHWRRIPYEKMGIDYNKLSPRMKKVMEFIETNELQKCDIFHIARYLKITPGYFSQLFKTETGQTFRGFMQKVLNYYENLLFLDWKMDVKSVSRLLGYSELSSYSRSFKNRKGKSPRAFAKLNVQP